MSEMSPKEALARVVRGMNAAHDPDVCPHCRAALAVLRSLVEQPTVEEVREEIENRLRDALIDERSCRYELQQLLDFIDRKGAE